MTIGNKVTGIYFADCSSLKSITIPDSVTNIEERAFSRCTSLTRVTIGNSVTNIGRYAFFGCTGLTSVTIGNNVTSIGFQAFYACPSLTNITIPYSVTSIEGIAFEGCTNLTSVTFQRTNINIDSYNPFPGDLREKYLASDGGSGTYTRFANGEVWKKQSSSTGGVSQQQSTTAQSTPSTQQTVKFPAGFVGTWKRDTYNNTLTFTTTNLKASNLYDDQWDLQSVSGDDYTIDGLAYGTFEITIKLMNGNLEISGDRGSGGNNWNGTWKKIR